MDRQTIRRQAKLAALTRSIHLSSLRLEHTLRVAKMVDVAKNESLRHELQLLAEALAKQDWGEGTTIDWQERSIKNAHRVERF